MLQLTAKDYSIALKLLTNASINTYFAAAVLTHKANGMVFVDDISAPTVAYIVHSYGMSLLIGNNQNKLFNVELKNYWLNNSGDKDEYLQAYPRCWDDILPEIMPNAIIDCNDNLENAKIIKHIRVNFIFNLAKFHEIRKNYNLSNYDVREYTSQEFAKFTGSVVADQFWRDAQLFDEQAKSIAVYQDGNIASVAFSSCKDEQILELGIETNPHYRGHGLAKIACLALIDYSLEQKLVPVWACRKGNLGSYNLALSLGFEVEQELSYYQFKKI